MLNVAFLAVALATATTYPTDPSAPAAPTPAAASSSVTDAASFSALPAAEFPSWFVPALLGKARFHALENEPLMPENKTGFRVTLVEIGAKGRLSDRWTYRFKFNAAVEMSPLDYYAEYKAHDGLKIRAGQFKTPFGRQEISHTGELALPDRALVAAASPGRDIGVMAHGQFGEIFGYAAGAFNGEGRNLARNINNDLLTVGRLAVTPWGRRVDDGESLYWRDTGLTLGVNAGYGRHGDNQNTEQILAGADASFYAGPFGLVGEWARVSYTPPGYAKLPAYTRHGYFVQPMVEVWKGWEWVVRYERYEPNSGLATVQYQDTEALRVGTNFYLDAGRELIQISYGKVAEKEGSMTRNNEIIAQLQIRME